MAGRRLLIVLYFLSSFLSSLVNDSSLWTTVKASAEFYQKFHFDCSIYPDHRLLSHMLQGLDYWKTRENQFWEIALNNEFQKALRSCVPEGALDALKKVPYDPIIPFYPITVMTEISLQSLIDLTNDGEVTLSALIEVEWPNNIWVTFLKNQKIDKLVITLEPHEIWTPTIWIDRCTGANCVIVPSNYTKIYYAPNHAEAYYMISKILEILCDPDLENFPYDREFEKKIVI